jgi:ammonia channel protein AmtB
MQFCYQLLSVVVAACWAFILTFLMLQAIGLLPFVKLKLSEKEEEM